MTLNPKNIEPAGSCDWFTIYEIPHLPSQLLRIFFMVPHIYGMEGSQNGKVFKSVRWGEEDINIQTKKQCRVENICICQEIDQKNNWWKCAINFGLLPPQPPIQASHFFYRKPFLKTTLQLKPEKQEVFPQTRLRTDLESFFQLDYWELKLMSYFECLTCSNVPLASSSPLDWIWLVLTYLKDLILTSFFF